jgi:hypothetical protein
MLSLVGSTLVIPSSLLPDIRFEGYGIAGLNGPEEKKNWLKVK